MGLGRYVVDAITLEGRSPMELARSHDISRTWIYELLFPTDEGKFFTVDGFGKLFAASGRGQVYDGSTRIFCATPGRRTG